MPPRGQQGAAPPIPMKAGPGMEINGYAQADAIYDFDQINPDWFDVERPMKLPAFPNEFGENGNFWAGVRPSPFRRQRVASDGPGRDQDAVRVRPLQRQPRRRVTRISTSGMPGASSARFSWDRPTPSSWTAASPRSRSSTGVPAATRPCATCSSGGRRCGGRTRSSSPSSGRAPPPTTAASSPASSCRTSRNAFPLPISRSTTNGPATGATCSSPASSATSAGWTRCRTEFDLTGHATGWGLNLSTNLKAREDGHPPRRGRLRRGHRELHDRRDPRTSAPPSTRRAIPGGRSSASRSPCSASRPFTTSIGTSASAAPSAIRGWTSTTATCSCRRRSTRVSTLSRTCFFTPSRTSWRASSFSGAGGPTSPTASASNDFRLQFSARYSFSFELGWGKR